MTAIVFGIAAVAAVEVALAVLLFGVAAADLGCFLRRHPHGVGGGARDLAAGMWRVWPAAKSTAKSVLAKRWATR
jgi:hypothetical protein